nr:hypothetical protein [Tanacetum cinerariifolium]
MMMTLSDQTRGRRVVIGISRPLNRVDTGTTVIIMTVMDQTGEAVVTTTTATTTTLATTTGVPIIGVTRETGVSSPTDLSILVSSSPVVPLRATPTQSALRVEADTQESVVELLELEAHYSYMAKIQVVPTADSCTDSEPLEQQLKKANTTLAQELKECETILAKTGKTLEESNSVRDSCLVALQNKQTEFEKYRAFIDRTVDYDKLKRKLNETLGQLAQKDIEIKEGLKLKAYEISAVKEKHDELIKQSLLAKSHYEGLVKQKTKVITDLKLKEEHDINKMLSLEKQLKFLNEIVYKWNQSIQTIHMMAPKVPTYNGRPTLANPRYLNQAQSEIPCLYAFMTNLPMQTDLFPMRKRL